VNSALYVWVRCPWSHNRGVIGVRGHTCVIFKNNFEIISE